MSEPADDIIQRLRQELLLIQGYKKPLAGGQEVLVGPVTDAFPNAVFPTGKLHEFVTTSVQMAAATGGFVAALSGELMASGGDCVWLARRRHVFPPGLSGFGVPPHRVVFAGIRSEKHLLWAAEEALQCAGIAAVVAEASDISYTASLRLQLAIEESRVTGFIIREDPRNLQPIASVARWRIAPVRSQSPVAGLAQVGFARWRVELEKVRNGRPGVWELEWREGKFQTIYPEVPIRTGNSEATMSAGYEKPPILAETEGRKAG